MLTFITSVRHPRNSADYGRVEELLRRSLASVCAQTRQDFRVVVACNRRPDGEFPSRVRFVEVDFPPPVQDHGPQTGREAVLRDKGTKLAVALLAAQDDGPDHIMKFDADDFVSRRIAEFVHGRSEEGWYVDHGWVLSSASGLITSTGGFVDKCGTSEILPNSFFRLPEQLPDVTASQEELLSALGQFTVIELLGSHRRSVETARERGRPLQPLPFPGAVYTIATGENHSGRVHMNRGRPVSRAQSEEFGLEHLRLRRAWISLVQQDTAAVARRLRSLAGSSAGR